MRLRHLLSTLLLLIFSSTSTTYAVTSEQIDIVGEGRQQGPKQALEPIASSAPISKAGTVPVGTKDAPVDGKDGKPHEGPFVETEAERTRKKAKESGDEEVLASAKKPSIKDDAKASPSKDTPPMVEKNDGVMDDPNRVGPKEGTRGTEGGISEKSKSKEGQTELPPDNKPDPPKEVPPLPQSEKNKFVKGDSSTEKGVKEDTKQKELGGLEKPTDLPDKPHDIPHPVPESSSKTDPLEITKPLAPSNLHLPEAPAALIQPLHSFVLSFTMIIFSEIGDKTFLIAALMAMKHPRMQVFSAAASALVVMTVLSAFLGHAVPTLIPKRFTNLLAAMLFLFFGLKMVREGYAISPNEGVSAEMREVEMELDEKEEMARRNGRRFASMTPYQLEAGRLGSRKLRSNSRLPEPPASPPSSSSSRSPSPSRGSSIMNALSGINNLCSLLLSPAWVQTFVMTFLGEWGDRSQIATIAMAAGQDYWWVTGGATTAHLLCTAAAVVGGRAIAGRVSLRVVTLGGGFAFLVFGVVYLLEAYFT